MRCFVGSTAIAFIAHLSSYWVQCHPESIPSPNIKSYLLEVEGNEAEFEGTVSNSSEVRLMVNMDTQEV